MIWLRNLLRARWRSLITVAGVAGGVALFITIHTITEDLQAQIDGATSQYRAEVVVSERRATSPMHSRISPAQMAELVRAYGDDLTPLVIGTVNEAWNPYALVVGALPRFVQQVPLVQGRPFVPERQELALGELAAQRLGLQPGQTVTLAGSSFTIAGVYRSGSRLFDSGLLMDMVIAQQLLFRDHPSRPFSVAALHVAGTRTPEQVMRDINTRHPHLRAVPGTELSGALRLIRVVRSLVSAIGLIAIFGTAVVLTNTLLMAVTERTREIGILMTVGWSPWLVLRMLAAESLALAIVGALLGDAGALGLLRVLNQMPALGFGWLPVSLAPQGVGLSVLLASTVALLALVWPAVVVARLQPLAALRHE